MNIKTGALLAALLFAAMTCNGCNVSGHYLESGATNHHVQLSDWPPTVQVKIDSPIYLNDRLKLHWKVLNNDTKPIYVYSSLLQRPSFAEIDIDAIKRVIEVRFLRLKPLELTPLSFPKTAFQRLNAGDSVEGFFVSDTPAEQFVEWESTDTDPVKEKIKFKVTPGTWTVRCLIAYGYEVESVQNNQEEGHPIDPVVKWQKVAYSEAAGLTIQK